MKFEKNEKFHCVTDSLYILEKFWHIWKKSELINDKDKNKLQIQTNELQIKLIYCINCCSAICLDIYCEIWKKWEI